MVFCPVIVPSPAPCLFTHTPGSACFPVVQLESHHAMLDIKFIRDNLDIVKAGALKKHVAVDFDRLIAVDDKRRELQALAEVERTKQNDVSRTIASQSAGERAGSIAKMRSVKEKLQALEAELREVMREWHALMVQVPNVPDMSVPEGESDAANTEVRVVGTRPTFSFPVRGHIELMERLGMLDLDRGAKSAGFRGYYLKNDGALLSFALWQFAIDRLTARGLTPLLAPSLVRREPFVGTGYLPQSEEDLYKTQDGDFLAGTAEVSTMSYYQDEVLNERDLPKKFLAFSPCFRREAGSYSKDTKGIIRVHEFYKLEQVVLCEASHQTSVALHEELTQNAEYLLQELEIPYHVVVNCGGDLGLGQVKKYDIEAWVPSQERYRETHSSSYFHDFQARRLNIRYRDADGKLRFVHSLNNTAIASPRILVPLLENHQQEDGSIRVPAALQPYLHTDTLRPRT